MKQFLFKTIGVFIRIYWKLAKPFSVGVRAIVINSSKRVLLVKHTYSNQWYLPGGGVHKQEHLVDALSRELKEEVGILVSSSPKLLGAYANFFEYKSDFIFIFIIDDFKMVSANDLEIDTWKWFDLEDIPINTSPGTIRRIQEYMGNKPINYIW